MRWVSLAALVAGLLYWVLPLAAKKAMRRRFLDRMRGAGAACLTFDDGPDPEATPAVLEILRRHRVLATFFLIGEKAEARPELVARIAEAGHEIGTHGYWHTFAWRTGPVRSFRDVIRGRQAVEGVVGRSRCRWLRPPYGKLNAASLLAVILGGQRGAFWNVDPRDYAQTSSETIARFVSERLRPGAVVLLHDGSMRDDDNWRVRVEALDALLATAAARATRFSTLSEAYATDAGSQRQGAAPAAGPSGLR